MRQVVASTATRCRESLRLAARHLREAEGAGLTAKRLPMQAFFRDIDLPDELGPDDSVLPNNLATVCEVLEQAETHELVEMALVNLPPNGGRRGCLATGGCGNIAGNYLSVGN